MKKLALIALLVGFRCLAADPTNITVEVRATMPNGTTKTNTLVLSAGELKTVIGNVAAINSAAAADTNLVSTTEQRYVRDLIQERLDRMRLVWLRSKRDTINSKIATLSDDALSAVEAEADKQAPK